MRFHSRTTLFCSMACVAALLATSAFAAPAPVVDTVAGHAKSTLIATGGAGALAPDAVVEDVGIAEAAEKAAIFAEMKIAANANAPTKPRAQRPAGGLPEAPDFVVAPGAGPFAGDTCGALDDCGVGTDDHVYEVVLPSADTWTFSLCGSGFDTKIDVGTTECGTDVGTNDDSCGLQSVVTAAAGPGSVFVTVYGFSGCGAYTLAVTGPPPANPLDDCTSAGTALDGTTAFDNAGATLDGTVDAPLDVDMEDDIWFVYNASCSGVATIETCPSAADPDTVMEVYDGGTATCGVGSMSSLGTSDDECSGSFESTLDVGVTSGNDYLVRLSGWRGGAVAGDLVITCTPPQGDLCATTGSPVGDGSYTGDTASGQTDSGVVPTCGSTVNPDEWWEYVAPCTGTATADTGGTGDDTSLAVYSDCTGAASEIACDDDGLGWPPGESSATFSTTAGNSYFIQVNGWGGGAMLAGYALNIACVSAGSCGDGIAGNFPGEECDGADLGACVWGCEATCLCSPNPTDECGTAGIAFDGLNPYDTTDATTSADDICDSNTADDIWMTYTSTCDGGLTFATCDGPDTVLQVYDGCGCPADIADTVICADDSGCGGGGFGSFGDTTAVLGNCYTVRLSGWNGGPIAGDLDITCTPAVCGNSIVEPSEECDPPDGVSCDAACQWICGDDIQQAGEDCDGTDIGLCVDGCDGGCSCTCGSTIADCDGTLSQSGSLSDSPGQVSCPNLQTAWGRCFDLAAEGVTGGAKIESVTFGVQVATNIGTSVGVNIYTDTACPASIGTATLAGSTTAVVGPGDVGTLITATFASPVAVAGGAVFIEIDNLVDASGFTPSSNGLVECGDSYIRAAACGLGDWDALGAIGFPDAHLVLQSEIACACGDGVVDTSIGETCDDGNTADGDCCSSTCTIEPATQVCRAGSGDACDPDELCDGTTPNCPGDTVLASGDVCRTGSGDSCDPDELCSGTPGVACPTDVVANAGDFCRIGSGDMCDPHELCTGTAGEACPADVFDDGSTVCRADAGDCDVAENCPGTAGGGCPADSFEPSGTDCGAGPALCSGQDTCDGAGTCDANHDADTVECRADAGECDVPDFCDGAGNCDADAFESFGTACGATPTECSDQDTCDGAGGCTNANHFAAGTPCGDGADTDCDNPDTCNGGGGCLDNFEASSTECRASVDGRDCPANETCDGCDPPEFCDGLGDCPGDVTITTAIDFDGCCHGDFSILSDNDCPGLKIPTVSQWGMITLSALLVVGLWIKFGRRETASA